jgi:hypothetical protein
LLAGLVGALLLWAVPRTVTGVLRHAKVPLIAFSERAVIFRQHPSDRRAVTADLASITGVECVVSRTARSYSAHVYLQRFGEESVAVDITALKAKPHEVFAAFKNRLPSLIQTNANEMRLLAPRYADSASNA